MEHVRLNNIPDDFLGSGTLCQSNMNVGGLAAKFDIPDFESNRTSRSTPEEGKMNRYSMRLIERLKGGTKMKPSGGEDT